MSVPATLRADAFTCARDSRAVPIAPAGAQPEKSSRLRSFVTRPHHGRHKVRRCCGFSAGTSLAEERGESPRKEITMAHDSNERSRVCEPHRRTRRLLHRTCAAQYVEPVGARGRDSHLDLRRPSHTGCGVRRTRIQRRRRPLGVDTRANIGRSCSIKKGPSSSGDRRGPFCSFGCR